ncbi:prepilin peptidase [Rouxiella sp. Mn2063]|uniref:prepilin peptidase n=1 Tax=Rouxiella sp. Mn2063 TaxID=3395262 RepID=UPI003BCB4A6F
MSFSTALVWLSIHPIYRHLLVLLCGIALAKVMNMVVILWCYSRHNALLWQSAIMLLCPSLFLALSFTCDDIFTLCWTLLLSWFLLALCVIDIRCYLLPDKLTLPLLWLGLISHSNASTATLRDAVYGAMLGYLAMRGIYWAGKKLIGREGLGYGDFKLMAALGAWLGWMSLPLVATFASVLGMVLFLLRYIVTKNSGALPFGPSLAISGLVIYISQPTLYSG